MSDTEGHQDRLDRLEDDIRAADENADAALGEPDEHRFYESGEVGEELDDQTIAPPG